MTPDTFRLLLVLIFLVCFFGFFLVYFIRERRYRIKHRLETVLETHALTKKKSEVVLHTTNYSKIIKKQQFNIFYTILCSLIFFIVVVMQQYTKYTWFIVGIYIFGLLIYQLVNVVLLSKLKKKFVQELPEMLDLMARTIAAGNSLTEAINIAAENSMGLLKRELMFIRDRMVLGDSLENAVHESAQRTDIIEFHYFSVVLNIQQQTGGNAVSLFGQISDSLRGKLALEDKIRTLTAESRATLGVLGAVPPMLLVVTMFLSPGFATPLFNTFAGNVVLGMAFLFELAGVVIILKMSNVSY